MIRMAQKQLPRSHTIDQRPEIGHIELHIKKSDRRARNTAVTAEMIGWEV